MAVAGVYFLARQAYNEYNVQRGIIRVINVDVKEVSGKVKVRWMALQMEHVGFFYEKDRTVLSDVTFHIRSGECVGLTGACEYSPGYG